MMSSNNNPKAFPSNEAIKKQIAKIAEDGNRPEDWKRYIDVIKLKAQSMDESKRNLILTYWYSNAFKSIPQPSASRACAQMLVDYAWIKSHQSVPDAENLLSYGRLNLRQFAIIHIASAELALKIGDKDKAKKFIKSAYSRGAEPVSLIKEAAKRLCMGCHQLICDEDGSSSSGHESSGLEMSGECSGTFSRNMSHKQEHSSNFPGLKYDTEELQEVFDLFSKFKETGNSDTQTKEEDTGHTSPVRNSHHHDDSMTSPNMPKTPKTPAFSSMRFQSIFNSKRHTENVADDNISGKRVPVGVTYDGASQLGVENHEVLRENSGLLNLVTPCAKTKPEGGLVPSSQKLGRNSSVSKLRSFASQPPRRVKVGNSSLVNIDDVNEDEEISTNDKESSQKLGVKRSVKQGLFATPTPKSITINNENLASESVSISAPFANSNTYSVHKTMTRTCNATKSHDEGESNIGSVVPVEKKLFVEDQQSNRSEFKAIDIDTHGRKAKDVINNPFEEHQVPLPNMSARQSNAQADLGGVHQQYNQMEAQQHCNMDAKNGYDRRDKPQPYPVLPQAMNPRMPPPVQNGQKYIYVNGKPYIVARIVGRGGSAKVYQVQDPETLQMKALKSVNLSGASHQILESYKNEIALLKKLQGCDCVIRLFDSEYDQCKQKLLVVMECGETDLANFIAKNGSIKNQDELYPVTVCYLWGNMVNAVRAMHKEGVIHSDLKPANFILVSGKIKLIDFGIANSIQQDKTSMLKDLKVGTPSYMSPEALMANDNTDASDQKPMFKIGFKSDVWSLGCILYQMVYGQTPFHNCRYKVDAITNPSHVINFPPTIDAPLTDILQKCLTRDVKLRPTTDELMMHPYLTKQRTETPVVSDPISNLMSEGASIASASPRSQQAFCLKFQKAMELMNSAKKPSA